MMCHVEVCKSTCGFRVDECWNRASFHIVVQTMYNWLDVDQLLRGVSSAAPLSTTSKSMTCFHSRELGYLCYIEISSELHVLHHWPSRIDRDVRISRLSCSSYRLALLCTHSPVSSSCLIQPNCRGVCESVSYHCLPCNELQSHLQSSLLCWRAICSASSVMRVISPMSSETKSNLNILQLMLTSNLLLLLYLIRFQDSVVKRVHLIALANAVLTGTSVERDKGRLWSYRNGDLAFTQNVIKPVLVESFWRNVRLSTALRFRNQMEIIFLREKM